jgi:predicted AlkP superfamily phosphohydrolase/phosphomutase
MSPSAWTSFMTGKNPGKHGVFDFTQRAANSYRTHVTTRTQEATLWGMLSQNGARVCVTNVPQTFPAETVNGIMITGLGTPAHNAYTYPPELGLELAKAGYRINPDVGFCLGKEMDYLQSVFSTAQRNHELTLELLRREEWDLFVTVLRLTDEIPHFFWHYMDSSHPYHVQSQPEWQNAILNAYRKADEFVGQLVDAANNALVIVMSDHGFGPLYKDVYLNEWLRQGGFVKLKQSLSVGGFARRFMQKMGFTRGQVGPALSRLRLGWMRAWLRNKLGECATLIPNDARPQISDLVDWQQTQAYSMGYIGQVYLNVQERDPEGLILSKDYQAVREQVIDHLMGLVDPEDGRPVVDRVVRREEVCQGPYAGLAPDLFVLMRGLTYITRESYDWPEDGKIFSRPLTGETGGHRISGMLIMHGASIRQGQVLGAASIVDIAPTILCLSGCAIPQDLDGNVLTGWLRPEVREDLEILSTPPIPPSEMALELSAADEDDLMQRLRDLGYVE